MNDEKPVRNIDMVKKFKDDPSVDRQEPTSRIRFGVVILLLALYPLSAVLFFTAGLAWGKHELRALIERNISSIYNTDLPEERETTVDFDPFWEAWALLDQKFVSTATTSTSTSESDLDQEKVWGAISGLTAAYGDPFTSFLPPEENEVFEEDISGEFSGVGMEIGNRNGVLTVISPIPKTPADRAGMRPKDVVSKVDGVDTLNMPVEQAVKLIKGPKGTTVVLTVLREGEIEPLEISIVRDIIKIPTVETAVVNDAFVIKLYSFTAQAPVLFQNAIKEFAQSGKDTLVLDLRGNPGGYLQAAVSVASWFLDADKLVLEEDFGGNRENKQHYSEGRNAFTDKLRFVILTNGGSASASEIVAGALRDHRRALLVGDTTFGKGSVQELFSLTGDTSLKITIAKWLTPSGDHISSDGLTVDVPIERPIETEEDGDNGTYNNDFSQDYMITSAIEVAKRSDFFELFDEIPEELEIKYINSEE